MQRKIYIKFYDQKPLEYMPVRPVYWCLWNEDYVRLFNDDASKLVHEITDQVNERYHNTWRNWDLTNVDYNTDKYI